jgi:plasmid replication initiation protein
MDKDLKYIENAALSVPSYNDDTMLNMRNQLIEASYKLPLRAHKILRLLLPKLREGQLEYRFPTSELFKALGYEEDIATYHTTLDDACKVLKDTGFELKSPKEKVHGGFVGTIVVREDEVLFALDPYLLKLYTLGNFTPIPLQMTFRWSNPYTFRIYEICKQYHNCDFVGNKQKWIRRVELSDLHWMLGVPQSYKDRFSNFNRNVLEPAKKDINGGSDLDIQIEIHKRKRTPIAVSFHVTYLPLEDDKKEAIEAYPEDHRKVVWLKKLDLHPSQIQKIWSLYAPENLDQLDEVWKMADIARGKGEVKNFPAFFFSLAVKKAPKPSKT